MAVKWSLAVRHGRLAAIEAAIGPAARLQFWSGAAPATAAAPTTGTKVGEVLMATDWMAAPAAGVVGLANLPLTTTALADGVVSYYRFVSNDSTTCHEQGSVTETGQGGDMIVDNATIKAGQTLQVTSFNKTEPGA